MAGSLLGPLCLAFAAAEDIAVSDLLASLGGGRGAHGVRSLSAHIHPSVAEEREVEGGITGSVMEFWLKLAS